MITLTKKITEGFETNSAAMESRFFCSKEIPPVRSEPT
jgi:hypothetical protein